MCGTIVEAVGRVEILEQPADQRGGRRERVVEEVDRLLGLVDVVAEVDQRVVHAEARGRR